MKSFSIDTRKANIINMASQKFDLFVIGGGITGAGIARDAAMRGMSVALVDLSDFASGTSSRSSKLIHGGIRYLENREFKLVFEALSERQKLFEIAPHLVHPLRFMIPLYRGGRVGMFKMGLGMWLYDALSLFQTPEMHEKLNPQESLVRMPSLQSEGLLGAYVYSDAYMDDDRLVHETLRSASAHGAVCANYVKAVEVELDKNNKVQKVICEDQLTGARFTVEAQHFVSCVGPWTDRLGEKLFKKWKSILRPTKGVHLTFEKKRFPLASAVVMGAEKRIVFGIPRHEMIIVGTTDTDFQGSPEKVVTTPEDVRYLLKVIHQYFPGALITAKDILASYAGVRPLVSDGSESENKTSREHIIFTDDHNLTFIAGGKYTTYRLIAQQVVEQCLHFFSVEDKVKFNLCRTNQPLNPLINPESRQEDHRVVDSLVASGSLKFPDAQLLVDRHGAEAIEIYRQFGPSSYWELEAKHAIEHTMCFRLVDFYSRRVPLILAMPDHGLSLLSEILEVFSHRLAWNEEQKQFEEKVLCDHLRAEFAWRHEIV